MVSLYIEWYSLKNAYFLKSKICYGHFKRTTNYILPVGSSYNNSNNSKLSQNNECFIFIKK